MPGRQTSKQRLHRGLCAKPALGCWSQQHCSRCLSLHPARGPRLAWLQLKGKALIDVACNPLCNAVVLT